MKIIKVKKNIPTQHKLVSWGLVAAILENESLGRIVVYLKISKEDLYHVYYLHEGQFKLSYAVNPNTITTSTKPNTRSILDIHSIVNEEVINNILVARLFKTVKEFHKYLKCRNLLSDWVISQLTTTKIIWAKTVKQCLH